MTLREKLVAKQRELGLTNQAFADKLGVHRVQWIRTKLDQIPMGRGVRLGAIEAFGLSEDQPPADQAPDEEPDPSEQYEREVANA